MRMQDSVFKDMSRDEIVDAVQVEIDDGVIDFDDLSFHFHGNEFIDIAINKIHESDHWRAEIAKELFGYELNAIVEGMSMRHTERVERAIADLVYDTLGKIV